MWSPLDAQCQPGKGTQLYVRRALRARAAITCQVTATRLFDTSGKITAVGTTAGHIYTGAAVLAGGIWTPYLAKTVG